MRAALQRNARACSLRGLASVLIATSVGAVACAESLPKSAMRRGGEPIDAIVVLGHRPPLDARGEVDYETRARVDRGVALFKAGVARRLVFAGGESTRGVIEADVMARYAEAAGVPSSAILRERESRDTIENARFTLALLHRELGPAPPTIALVTSDYHIARATRLLRCAGAHVFAESVPLALDARERRRRERGERFVRLYYWFIAECGRSRAT